MLGCMESATLSLFLERAPHLDHHLVDWPMKDSLGGNIGGDAAAMPTRNINWPR